MNNTKAVRCVNRKTGQVAYNIALYAYDKSWQRSTGFYPESEPKQGEFSDKVPIHKQPEPEQRVERNEKQEESKPKTNNEITETAQANRSGRPTTEDDTITRTITRAGKN